MNITIERRAGWFTSLDSHECELVIKLQVFSQLLYARLKSMAYEDSIEDIRALGDILSDVMRINNLSSVDFNHAYKGCVYVRECIKSGRGVDSRYELTEEEAVLLDKIIQLSDYIPSMSNKLFSDDTYLAHSAREYVIEYSPYGYTLHLKAGAAECSFTTGVHFALTEMLKYLVGAKVTEVYTDFLDETYQSMCTICPDVIGTTISRALYMITEYGYTLIYDWHGTKILYKKICVGVVESVVLYCVMVVDNHVTAQTRLRFPVDFLESIRQSGQDQSKISSIFKAASGDKQ